MKKERITVACGQTYRVPRRGKQAAYVRITRVTKGQQPKVSYRRVTRSGRKRSGEMVLRRWLSFFEGAWRLPPDWEVIT
jgi:hypothetical protein